MWAFDFRSVALCVSTLLLTVSQASAHEKWFHETQSYGLRWDLFFRPLPLALFGAVLLATLAAGLWWRKRRKGFVPGPEDFGTTDERRAALYGLIPMILCARDRWQFSEMTAADTGNLKKICSCQSTPAF